MIVMTGAVVVFVVAAWLLFRYARYGWPAVARILRHRTRPVAQLAEGPVEIAGTIRARDDDPIVAPSGDACVFVEVKVMAYDHGGKGRTRLFDSNVRRAVDTVLVDDAGDAVEVRLENAVVVGGDVMHYGPPAKFSDAVRAWCTDVPANAGHVDMNETHLRHGVRGIVSGHARVVDAKVEVARDGAEGYRGGDAVERKRFVVEGKQDAPLLASEGSEAKLLFRAAWPVALLGLCTTLALAFAASLLALLTA